MDLFTELVKTAGAAGVVAAILYKMLINEQKAHDVTRSKYEASLIARAEDNKEISTGIVPAMDNMAEGFRVIGDKIESGRRTKR